MATLTAALYVGDSCNSCLLLVGLPFDNGPAGEPKPFALWCGLAANCSPLPAA